MMLLMVATLTLAVVNEFDRTIDGGRPAQVVLVGSIAAIVATVAALALIKPPRE